MHRVRGDAIHCTAQRGLKAQVVKLMSLWRVNVGQCDDDGGDAGVSWQHHVWSDLALVPPSCRGVHTRALYYRQMTSAGMPTWLLDQPFSLTHIKFFLWVTDAGPDQKECGAIMSKEIAADCGILLHHDFCVFHQLQLIVKKSLVGEQVCE